MVSAGSKRREQARPNGQLGEPGPCHSIVVCAWCACNGRRYGAARNVDDGVWYDVSHAFVTAVDSHDRVSHGMCRPCAALERARYQRARAAEVRRAA